MCLRGSGTQEWLASFKETLVYFATFFSFWTAFKRQTIQHKHMAGLQSVLLSPDRLADVPGSSSV